jgi:pyoverdine/dityrosine biosynthesis protein Dit1
MLAILISFTFINLVIISRENIIETCILQLVAHTSSCLKLIERIKKRVEQTQKLVEAQDKSYKKIKRRICTIAFSEICVNTTGLGEFESLINGDVERLKQTRAGVEAAEAAELGVHGVFD